jgi:hypothetical protein
VIDIEPTLALPELDEVAEAIAAKLRRAVEAQGERWNKSGRLAAGIKADGTSVVVPPGRLERDPELAKRFHDEVQPSDPFDDRAVREAIAKALHDAVSGEK